MISFCILTSTPLVVRNFLIARGILQLVTNPLTGQQEPVGVRPGVEWREVNNPIVTTAATGTPLQPGYVPPVMDVRRVYAVKVAHEAKADEIAGEAQVDAQGVPRLIWERTKLGKWIRDNSTAVTHTDASGKTYRGRKVNAQQIWLFREDDTSQYVHNWQ